MNLSELQAKIKLIKSLKDKNSYLEYDLGKLQELPSFNGIVELNFLNNKFYMINLNNDDSVPLKYLWRGNYEEFSLEIWHQITRSNNFSVDVGAHTGIYSIIANINKNFNNVISIEPYFLNYSRLIDNLKINKIDTKLCFLAAASNFTGSCKFKIKAPKDFNHYKTQGGKISQEGQLVTPAVEIDKLGIHKTVDAIKIDTEGHEYEVLSGSIKIIQLYKPHIIIEINKLSFDKSFELLRSFEYRFFAINEKEKKLNEIFNFEETLLEYEGVNCLASCKINELKNLI